MSKELKASRLMVGDWIYAIDDEGNKHLCRVNDIKIDYTNKTEDFCVDFSDTDYEAEWPDVMFDTQPIPLSEDILRKNFPDAEPTGVAWWPCNFPTKIPYYHISYNKDCTIDIDICYVHQLQHILRLVGEEKEVEL